MYPLHAYQKYMLLAVDSGSVDLANTGATKDLTAGQIGLFTPSGTSVITSGTGANQKFVLAVGSWRTSDKIGPYHGGYAASDKTKVINPQYVTRFMKKVAVTPQNQVVAIGWDTKTSSSNDETFEFKCGNTYRLRLDLKGSPLLRFLSHNAYKTIDAFAGCCDDNCNTGCTGDPVDPAIIFLQWKDRITQDPWLSQFITPRVYYRNSAVSPVVSKTEIYSEYDESLNGANTAYVPLDSSDTTGIAGQLVGLKLTVAYADTRFGNCTFTVTDHYELEPIQIYASVTDDKNDPCAVWPTANTSTGELVTELTAPRQAEGSGESYVRALINSDRYKQEYFHDGGTADSLRKREIEGAPGLDNITRTALYDEVMILHNVPRYFNGLSNDDQYLIHLLVPTGTTTTNLTNLIQTLLGDVDNGVTLETL